MQNSASTGKLNVGLDDLDSKYQSGLNEPLLAGDGAVTEGGPGDFGNGPEHSVSGYTPISPNNADRQGIDFTPVLDVVEEEPEIMKAPKEVKEDIGDIIPNNTDKSIDFNAQLKALKKRTEIDLPYTPTQVEDAMYLDQYNVVTLEYHYYQNDCKYIRMTPQKEHWNDKGMLVDDEGHPIEHKLGTHSFQPEDEDIHPMSQFEKRSVKNYLEDPNAKCVLKTERALGTDSTFMRVGNTGSVEDLKAKLAAGIRKRMKKEKMSSKEDDTEMIEPILSLYKVNAQGGMMRNIQIQVKMGRQFFPSNNGNMVLQRSKDKKVVSLTNFNRESRNQQYFKTLAWTNKLKVFDVAEAVNEGMNAYFHEVQDSFDQLVEVSYTGNSKYIQLIYIESKERSLEDKQAYEKEIEKKLEASKKQSKQQKFSKSKVSPYQMRNIPRKAKKYVYFDAATGRIAFEYGGVREQMTATTADEREVPIYELGVLVKEIREEQFLPQFVFLYCGDFMDYQVKEQQMMYKWGLQIFKIPMKQIFEIENPDEQRAFIEGQIRKLVSVSEVDGKLSCYPFDHNWIEQQRFNWEISIHPTARRKFDQFALLNTPYDKNDGLMQTYMVNGPRFDDNLDLEKIRNSGYIVEVPYYSKLPQDCQVDHSRNQNIKDQLFYDVKKNNETKTYCLRLDHADLRKRYSCIKLPKTSYTGQKDCWLHLTKSNKEFSEVFQTFAVTTGDQKGHLLTAMDNGVNSQEYEYHERFTDTFYQQQADLPCIAYNVGDNRVFIKNTLQTQEKKEYIIDLEPNERFVCFVKFNQFEDIGFYPKGLRIECCSHFAFLTTANTQKGETGSVYQNKLNLILIDPFYPETQIAHYKSTTYYDHSVFRKGENIVAGFIQSTMAMKRDSKYKTYLWLQVSGDLCRSQLLRPGAKTEDSDIEEDELDSDEDEQDDVKAKYQHVKIKMNDRDFMYYIKSLDGKCFVMEGNPREQNISQHEAVFELKAEYCLAFDIGESEFFFMDENFVVHMLVRNDNNRKLTHVKELSMKEIQTLDFKPMAYDDVIITEKYAIQGTKIYYLYDLSEEPYPEGVFEAEELIEEDKTIEKSNYIKGPICIGGSMRYFDIYRKSKFVSHIRIYQKPCSTSKMLINDYQNFVDMSSFLDDGKILVKIRRRFMVFTSDGGFLNEVTFDDSVIENLTEESEEEVVDNKLKFGTALKKANNKEKFKKGLQTDRDGGGDLPPKAVEQMKHRMGKEKILDFQGNEWDFIAPSAPPPMNDENKMELLNMSFNNKYYLFYNRINQKFLVYELVVIPTDTKPLFNFVLKYDLDVEFSFLFETLYTMDINPTKYYRDNLSQIKINNKAEVFLCYVENLPFMEKDATSDAGVDDTADVYQCRLVGSIFRPDGDNYLMNVESFTQVFDFPRDAQEKLENIFEAKKIFLRRKIKTIQMIQQRLPAKLHDYAQYENLIKDLVALEQKKSDNVYAKVYFDNLVVIYCGQYIKYGWLVPNKKKKKKSKESMDLVIEKKGKQQFKNMAAYLSDGTEVLKVIETCDKNWLQFVLMDHYDNILTIVTWDFDQNVEQGILQMRPNEENDVGYHVVKGMNLKRNYFLNKNFLTDLEYNIPLRQVNVDQDLDIECISYSKQVAMINDYFNQRKIFRDNSKFLGVEKACALFYPLSRIDLILWQNINVLGEKPELIEQTCKLQQFNLVIEGNSLFHYFADNADMIATVKKRFDTEKQNGNLSQTDETLPLQILNPDNNGKTALYLAVSKQSPQSFECMVMMLQDFPELCLSKMMLKSLALILSHEAPSVIEFFQTNLFQPPQMQIEQFIPWGEDMEELVFTSHTSIMSSQLLMDVLIERGIAEAPKKAKKKKSIKVSDVEDGQQESAYSKRLKVLEKKKNLRGLNLDKTFDTGLPEGEIALKRVQIEALDFDWVFSGDNAKILLSVLASDANNQALTKSSIKTFVELMWSHFKIAIVKKIFFPYIIYLCVINLLAGNFAGQYIFLIEATQYDPETENPPSDELVKKFEKMKIITLSLLGLSTLLMTSFASLEIGQLIQAGPMDYFSDFWNIIDFTSISTNAVFLSLCGVCFVKQEEFFGVDFIRTFGAFACFFMWIKVFYWMRLFSSLAYYVALIQQTLIDSTAFMVMVALIIFAFANFIYVIGKNLSIEEPDSSYYNDYVGNQIIDVLISIYMLGALGDFDSDAYKQGYDRYVAMFMFIMATFIVQVVFMNMLIAIMGETFGQVLECAEESGLREQVVLIDDHAWLLDLKKIFKGQRYIIKVTPSSSSSDENDIVCDTVKESTYDLMKRLQRLQTQFEKRIDTVDVNTRYLLKYQSISIFKGNKRVKQLEKIVKDQFNSQNEDEKDLTKEEKLERETLNRKKKDLLTMLNLQATGETLTVEKIQEIALNWIEIADKDGNGELDYQEFYDFFSNIEGIQYTEEEIRQIFQDFNVSGNDTISVEEFAKAIHQAILADNEEYSEKGESSDDYGIED